MLGQTRTNSPYQFFAKIKQGKLLIRSKESKERSLGQTPFTMIIKITKTASPKTLFLTLIWTNLLERTLKCKKYIFAHENMKKQSSKVAHNIKFIFLVPAWLPKRPIFGRNRNFTGSTSLLSLYSLIRRHALLVVQVSLWCKIISQNVSPTSSISNYLILDLFLPELH